MTTLFCLTCGKKHAESRELCDACSGPLAPSPSGQDPLIGQRIGNKYLVVERIGRGGMGAVYRATQENLDRPVAIKVVGMGGGDHIDLLRRFYAEAKNTSRLQHPHNVKVFDFGHTESGSLYIVMELLAGEPLSRLSLPVLPERALSILEQVSAALGEAHTIGLIHRDLKPDNIIISQVDGRDFARVLDYGIAKSAGTSTVTRDG